MKTMGLNNFAKDFYYIKYNRHEEVAIYKVEQRDTMGPREDQFNLEA